MNEETKKDYSQSIDFWDSAYATDDDVKKQYTEFLSSDPEAWKGLATSPKLLNIITENLSGRENVLDYGCGDGWAGLCIKKSGAKNVKCVDVTENSISLARFLQGQLNITEGFDAEFVSTQWLSTVPADSYDGIVTSNVLDVIPAEAAEDILQQLNRIAKKGARIVVGLNFYQEPKDNPEHKVEIKNGNMVFINGILRMVSLTDEEWTALLGKYFTVEKLDHFAWEGEETERRRVFVLSK